jgi:ubiquinone/menaquinone biosynthesis C-methylase UbiE
MTESALSALQQRLVCPVCKGKVAFSPGLITCLSCARRFSQSSSEYFDLVPPDMRETQENQWGGRQQEMEEWYEDLIADPAAAGDCFAHDYTPYGPILGELSGEVLDVGGGIGIVREYLPQGTHYTVIDPSLEWLNTEWASLADRFPSLKTTPRFVRGIGEYLPFPAQSFDAVLSFWSLNHVSYPEQVFNEANRVLRSGGRFVVVLEDMPPSWGDIAEGAFPASKVAPGGGDPSMDYPAHPSGREWPLQTDHLRIRESDIRSWVSQGFEVARREWIGQYLTFVLRKIEPVQYSRTGTKDTKARQNQDDLHVLRNERRQFVQRLQAYEQQLQEVNNALVSERQRNRRLRRRMQSLNQQPHEVRASRTRRLLNKLGRIQLWHRGNDV